MIKRYVKTDWKKVTAGIVFAVILGAYGANLANKKGGEVLSQGNMHRLEFRLPMQTDCLETSSRHFHCTEPEVDAKAALYEGPWYDASPKVTFRAIQTHYSRKDSCHYPRKTKDGRIECLTAIGRDTKEGTTVACPRNIKLGTKVYIEGIGERVCEDRYNEGLDEERNLPTVDVFAEGKNLHTIPPYRAVLVTILK